MSINLNVTGNTQPLEAAVNAAINRIRKTPIKITVDDKGATQPLGNMKRGADEFSKSMEAANSRIIAFGASMAIINGVADGFKALVKNVVEVEKALADINVVMNLSTANLEKFSNGLFKTAKETGAAFNVAAEAATEYARQGLTMEESLKRTRDALILTRLTGMDSANAVKALTAAMNTYGDQIKDTTELVSKFAAVDVKFAVSAEDFADAISRTGQAAKSAGVDIDELVGLVTAAQQQTARGGKVIGNSFKTIFTRIGRSDTLNQLENLGIAVRDLEGNTLGAKRILTDLANTFDKLTASQQNQIAQTVGGVFQINVLKAVLSDAAKQNGILANATQISSGATTEAIDKNDQLRQTMSAMATETGLALKELSAQIGEIMLAPGMEKVLNVFKGLAEGANEMLGGGESTGSDFAQGFLKGLGNIITGPGLVVISAVFIKLFAKALVYANQSLRSLIGVTSEAHKQKAIQTSLVTLFGQNAAISKEMLRTDISRTEKERIILGLLKAQVIEANMLNSVSKSVAGGLYARGYNANLAPRKGRAGGHIPNFADPEREQAARGGYAAGTIRSMNMPGEGSVIYNSAEKVKNFKGMSQPAIMPPHSSKAGKNYQQAFGDVHGFDPYAAGGYVPNYAGISSLKPTGSRMGDYRMLLTQGSKRKGQFQSEEGFGSLTKEEANLALRRSRNKKTTASTTSQLKNTGLANIPLNLNQIPLTRSKINNMGVILGQGKEGLSYPTYSQPFSSLPKELRKKLLPYMKSIKGRKYGLGKMPTEDSDHWKRKVTATLPTKAVYAVSEDDAERMEKAAGADTLKAALKGSIGPGFDKFSSKIGQKLFGSKSEGTNVLEKHVLSDGSALGALFEAGVRGALNNKALTGAEQQRPFDFVGSNAIALSTHFMGLKKARDKIEAKKDFGAAKKGDIPKKVLNAAAGGYIPNFADPLSDAIGREKEAGVPVSQIRVGSHPALMGKSNPIGLGVTNTHDEPNGLKDVFGAANGFVPNYFNPIEKAKTAIGESGFGKNWKKATTERTKAIKIETNRIKSRTKSLEKHQKELTTLTQGTREHAAVERKIRTTTQNLDKATQKKTALLNSPAPGVGGKMGRFSQDLGNSFSGNKGMMMMMGAPMAAGFLQSDGPGQAGMGGAAYSAGGALTGAASGAMMASMVAPMFGPAAPLVIAMGGLVGGFKGFISAQEENTKALEKNRQELVQKQTQTASQSLSKVVQASELRTSLKQASLVGEGDKLGLGQDDSVINLIREVGKKSKGFNFDEKGQGKGNLQGINKGDFERFSSLMNWNAKTGNIESKSKFEDGDAETSIQWYNQQTKKRTQRESEDFKVYKKVSKKIMDLPDNQEAPMPQDLRSFLKSRDGNAEAGMNASIDYILKNEAGNEFEFGDEKFDRENYRKLMKGERSMNTEGNNVAPLDLETRGNALTGQAEGILDKENKANGEKLKGIIVQIDTQRMQITAQRAIAMKQLEIKDRHSEISENLKFEVMLMGSLMTDKQKAENKYLQAINKSAEAYEKSAASADGQLRTGLLNQIKGSADVQGLLKESLGLEKGAQFQDISDKVGSLTGGQMVEKLKEIAADSDTEDTMRKAINDLLIVEIDKRQNILDIAEKTKTNSTDQATREQKINNILAGRSQIIKDLERENRMSSEDLRSSQKIRGFTEQVAAAKRLNAVGPGYQTKRERENFTMSEKRFGLESKITTLEENKAKSIGELNTEKEKTNQVIDQDKLKNLRQNKKDAEDYSEPLLISDQDLETLNKLEELEVERIKKLEEIEQKIKNINSETDSEISKATILLEKEKERLEIKRKHETGPGAFGRGFRDTAKEMGDSVETFNHELGNTVAVNFRDGIAEAMKVGLNGADDLGDALMSVASNFLGAIQNAFLQNAANAIVSKIPMPSGNYTGGAIRNYSRGGGVPAMVSDGEYVMSSKAVSKYGGSFMHGLNAGGNIPGFSEGGAAPGSALAANFGGGRGIDTGRAHQSKAMSGFFYSQSGNLGLKDDEQALVDVLAEEERKRQEAAAKKAKKRALIKQIIGTAASFAVSYGLSGGFSGGGGDGSVTGDIGGGATVTPVSKGGSGVMQSSLDVSDADIANMSIFDKIKNSDFLSFNYQGGPIRKYASGGHITGKSGIDQIPAMLSEGEYVIRSSSARQIGKPTLDRINAGKFNDGGSVSPINSSSESAASGGSTNNINISINMENGKAKNGSSSSSSSGGNSSEASDGQQDMVKLGEKVKQQVLTVIVEEKRPGGLLHEQS